MSQDRRWTVYTEEVPASDILAWPPDLSQNVVNFLLALALEVGGAVNADKPPPGDPVNDLKTRYSLQIPGEPVILEYEILREIREIRVPVLVWVG